MVDSFLHVMVQRLAGHVRFLRMLASVPSHVIIQSAMQSSEPGHLSIHRWENHSTHLSIHPDLISIHLHLILLASSETTHHHLNDDKRTSSSLHLFQHETTWDITSSPLHLQCLIIIFSVTSSFICGLDDHLSHHGEDGIASFRHHQSFRSVSLCPSPCVLDDSNEWNHESIDLHQPESPQLTKSHQHNINLPFSSSHILHHQAASTA